MTKINLLFNFLINIFVTPKTFEGIFSRQPFYVDKDTFINPNTIYYKIVSSEQKIYRTIEDLKLSGKSKVRAFSKYRGLIVGFRLGEVVEVYGTKNKAITYKTRLERIK